MQHSPHRRRTASLAILLTCALAVTGGMAGASTAFGDESDATMSRTQDGDGPQPQADEADTAAETTEEETTTRTNEDETTESSESPTTDEDDSVSENVPDGDSTSSSEDAGDAEPAQQDDSANEQDAAASDADVPPNPRHMWTAAESTDDETQSAPRARMRAAAPGVRWSTTGANGRYKTFTQSNGAAITPALKVIDVSEWQKDIDWNQVKNSGIDGVILRLGYGYGNEDVRFAANLAKVRALRIPYGVYLYSYAYDTAFAREEGNWTVQLLRKYRITDNSFPIFYDLEQAQAWGGHTMPSRASQYEPIARTYFNVLASAGYSNAYIYSYLNYMNTALNSAWLHGRTAWIAQYNTKLDYTYPNYNGARAWQYTSSARVPGIDGNVDVNVFDQKLFRDVTFRTPHYGDVMWLTEQGITTGFADGTFRGMSAVVRQDMAAFLRREASYRGIADARTWKPSAADWRRFTDVNRGTPHAEDILWLAHAGIATGYPNGNGTWRFEGMTKVYRQDMAAFLKRLADKAGKSGGVTPRADFTDVNARTPHAAEIRWLGGARITEGYQNANGSWRFEGMTTVYRQDMAAFIHRLDNRLA